MMHLDISENLETYAASYGLDIEAEEHTPTMHVARVVTGDHSHVLAIVRAQGYGPNLGVTVTYGGAGNLDAKQAGQRAQALKVAVAICTDWQRQAKRARPQPLTRQEFQDLLGLTHLTHGEWVRIRATIDEGWADE